MMINTQMSQAEINSANELVNTFNTQLKEQQKVVSKNALGEADFLQLMITQLKNQDPTKPMEDKQFIAQMAQFTSLKQMNNLAATMSTFTKEFSFTKAVALVQKEINWTDGNGRLHQGVVDSVRVKGGESYLVVGDQEVQMTDINSVK